MTTILNPFGLLAYGDNDGSVIWRSPLTSEASISTPEIGGQGTFANEIGGQTFDAIKGLKPGIGSYQLGNIVNRNACWYGGQIYFELETQMLACTPAVAENSSGGVPQILGGGGIYEENILTFIGGNLASANDALFVRFVDKSLFFSVGNSVTSVQGPSLPISDAGGKGKFTRIVLAWIGNTHYLFVDDVLHSTAVRATNIPTNSPITTVFIGRSLGGFSNYNLISGFMRKLQISSRPPIFSVHPLTRMCVNFGDSYAYGGSGGWNSTTYNLGSTNQVDAALHKLGLKVGAWSERAYGGRKVIGTGNAALYLRDNIVTALLDQPTTVFFQAGRNDVTTNGTLDVAAFTLGMHAIIEQFFGVNGYPATTTQRFIISTLMWSPVYTASGTVLASVFQADTTSINNVYAGLPAWFSTTYPSLAGRVTVVDTFNAFGGYSNLNASTYWTLADPIHPSNLGNYVKGKSWANGLLAILGS